MTSKTSLFNKGIFKSTIKRFLWGSILYFAFLFLTTTLPFLINSPESFYSTYIKAGWHLFDRGICTLTVVGTSLVPYITALLIFRFIHSKKQSIFVHSLPVNRSTNFVSASLGAFVLMAAPVIANALILFIMSVSTYGNVISPLSILIWIGINLFALIVMYSIATFSCQLTGNTFGAVVIYLIVHLVPLIITSTADTILQNILNGYKGNNFLADTISEINPFAYVVRLTESITRTFANENPYVDFNYYSIFICLIMSLVMLCISFYLYKKRKLENAEDVAGFKILNPILKYTVTLTVAFVTIAIGIESAFYSPVAFVLAFILTTGITYFICEMVLRKSLKVFGAYKGYAGFVVAITAIFVLINITNGFGYETYLPDASEVKGVGISAYNGYNSEVIVEDKELVNYAIKIHNERIENPYMHPKANENYLMFDIRYKLNNDKLVKRTYRIPADKMNDIMNELYTYDVYVKNYDDFYARGISEITEMRLCDDRHSKDFLIDEDQITGLYNALEKDILSLSFKEMYCIDYEYALTISMSYILDEKAFNNTPTSSYEGHMLDNAKYARTQSIRITPRYKNTMKWLEDEGYLELIKIPNDGNLYLREGGYNYIEGVELLPDTIKITNAEEVNEILDYILKNPSKDVDSENLYTIYYNPSPSVTSSVRELCEISYDKMPELLKNHIN